MALTRTEERCDDRWRSRKEEQLRRQIEQKPAHACAGPRSFPLQTPEFRDRHGCEEEAKFFHSAASPRRPQPEGFLACPCLRRQCFPPAIPERRLSQPCGQTQGAATIRRRRFRSSVRQMKPAARQASD